MKAKISDLLKEETIRRALATEETFSRIDVGGVVRGYVPDDGFEKFYKSVLSTDVASRGDTDGEDELEKFRKSIAVPLGEFPDIARRTDRSTVVTRGSGKGSGFVTDERTTSVIDRTPPTMSVWDLSPFRTLLEVYKTWFPEDAVDKRTVSEEEVLALPKRIANSCFETMIVDELFSFTHTFLQDAPASIAILKGIIERNDVHKYFIKKTHKYIKTFSLSIENIKKEYQKTEEKYRSSKKTADKGFYPLKVQAIIYIYLDEPHEKSPWDIKDGTMTW